MIVDKIIDALLTKGKYNTVDQTLEVCLGNDWYVIYDKGFDALTFKEGNNTVFPLLSEEERTKIVGTLRKELDKRQLAKRLEAARSLRVKLEEVLK